MTEVDSSETKTIQESKAGDGQMQQKAVEDKSGKNQTADGAKAAEGGQGKAEGKATRKRKRKRRNRKRKKGQAAGQTNADSNTREGAQNQAADNRPAQKIGGGNVSKKKTKKKKKKKTNQKGKRRLGPETMGTVREGSSNRDRADKAFTVYSKMSMRTVNETVNPGLWFYREAVANLAKHGQGRVIGQINELVSELAARAIAFHQRTEQQMREAIAKHEQRRGEEITVRAMEDGHVARIVTVGPATDNLVDVAKTFDSAVRATQLAYSVGATPWKHQEDMIREMIIHNVQVKNGIKAIAKFIQRRVMHKKIAVEDMRAWAKEAMAHKDGLERIVEQDRDKQLDSPAKQTDEPEGGPQKAIKSETAEHPPKAEKVEKKKATVGNKASQLLRRLTGEA